MGGLSRLLTFCLAVFLAFATPAAAKDLDEIKAAGVLRHIGIPYANFVTGQGDGLDVDIIKAFANHLGVSYAYIQADWDTAIPDLVGKTFSLADGKADITGDSPVRGDILANGLTVLEWRKRLLSYSAPTFPTQVWLVVRADSNITPITPTGDIKHDVEFTRGKLKDLSILAKSGTCLDPALFNLGPTGAKVVNFPGSLNDLAPAVIIGEAEATLLDVPDAMVALQKFPGKLKIIGPLTEEQEMAVGFRIDQPKLRAEFDTFFREYKASGRYAALVRKYYPMVFSYFPGFFTP